VIPAETGGRQLESRSKPQSIWARLFAGSDNSVDAQANRAENDRGQNEISQPIADPKTLRQWQILIEKSGLFDANYYALNYPSFARTISNPLDHFLLAGTALGWNPHPLFDIAYYLGQNAALLNQAINPLVHYISEGTRELRNPHPLFDSDFYLAQYPALDNQNVCLLDHFLKVGCLEGANPNAFFDLEYYLSEHPDVVASGMNPLVHYLLTGASKGYNPSRRFDTRFYLQTYPDVLIAGVNPLSHYIQFGNARNASPRFALPKDLVKVARFERLALEGTPIVLYIIESEHIDTRQISDCLRRLYGPLTSVIALHRRAGDPREAGKNDYVLAIINDDQVCSCLFSLADQLDELIGLLRWAQLDKLHIRYEMGQRFGLSQLIEKLNLPYGLEVSDNGAAFERVEEKITTSGTTDAWQSDYRMLASGCSELLDTRTLLASLSERRR
jgi:hypothetical protein